MNIYAIIILSTILFEFILSQIADRLNLKNMSPDLPEDFDGFYDEEKYRQSQNYTRTYTRFGFIVEIFDLTVLLLFWFLGGFNWLDLQIRAYDLSPIWNGLIFMDVLVATKSIISLPFSLYTTFVIEEKFGFNRTTLKTFILDRLKGMLLGILIGAPLMAGVLAIFEYLGSYAWLVGWGVVTLVSLMLSYIAPTWIMPLFNKFEPLNSKTPFSITPHPSTIPWPAFTKLTVQNAPANQTPFLPALAKIKESRCTIP